MYFLELLDILFFIKCLKFPDPSFPVLNFVSFSNTKTRSSSFSKLIHNPCSSRLSQQSYFSRIARLWNTLPPIDTSVPFSTIKFQLKKFFGLTFLLTLILHFHVHFMLSVPVANVVTFLLIVILQHMQLPKST